MAADSTPKKPPIAIFLIAYLLLAIFTANAANKFFVNELKADEVPYSRIVAGEGDAPDQYRIAPILPYIALNHELPVIGQLKFNYQVLLYNSLFCFLTLLLFHFLLRNAASKFLASFQVIFCITYIYFLHSGWRPDTMGLLSFCAGSVVLWEVLRHKKTLLSLAYPLTIILLSFSRAEIALIFTIYALFSLKIPLLIRVTCIPIPILIQILLKYSLFPDAEYYTKVFMLWDNLGLFYLYRNPGTYLIPAVLILFFKPVKRFLLYTWMERKVLLLLLAGYVLVILFIGRINEWRLYLPFLPLFLVELNKFMQEKKEAAILQTKA